MVRHGWRLALTPLRERLSEQECAQLYSSLTGYSPSTQFGNCTAMLQQQRYLSSPLSADTQKSKRYCLMTLGLQMDMRTVSTWRFMRIPGTDSSLRRFDALARRGGSERHSGALRGQRARLLIAVCAVALVSVGCSRRYDVSGLSCPTDRVEGVAIETEPTLTAPEQALQVAARATNTASESWHEETRSDDSVTWIQRDSDGRISARTSAERTATGWTSSGATRCA